MGQTPLELERSTRHWRALEYWEAACACPGAGLWGILSPKLVGKVMSPCCPPVAPRDPPVLLCSLGKVWECLLHQVQVLPLPFLNSGRGLLPILEHSPVLGLPARHPRPFQSLEVTQAPGPGGQILLWDTERHVASPSPLQLAPEPGRRCGKAKWLMSAGEGQVQSLPPPQTSPTAHYSDPKTCLPAPPQVEGPGCHQPALPWKVHAWLAACPGDKDLCGREKPCVEFFSLDKAGGGKGSGFFARLDLRRNALWEGSSMQSRNAASFQYSAALWVLQLGRAAEGQRPLQGGVLLSPCPWHWPSTTGFSLWAVKGSWERWFSYRVMKALEVWRL